MEAPVHDFMVLVEAHPLDIGVLLELHVKAVPPRVAAAGVSFTESELTLRVELVGPLRDLDARDARCLWRCRSRPASNRCR